MNPTLPAALSSVLTPTLLATVLVAIAVLAALRQGWQSRRRGDAGWRLVLLVAGQFALAALLWRVLLPPAVQQPGGVLVVATAATPADVELAADEILVVLPEAMPRSSGEPVPDLGTALRRHPQMHALRVLGSGLPARDRGAARGLALQFVPTPPPTGLVELQAPPRATAGRRWVVRGRSAGSAGQSVELLDPAGTRQARQTLAEDGVFSLAAVAGPAGRAAYRLQRRDADGAVVETLELPLQVDAGAPLKLLVLAGGVNAETKYLRRWALDAGLALTSQASVGGGIDIGQPVAAPSRERFAAFDLVLLDERSWRSLGPAGRAALRAAVNDGLGVLLRLGADPDASERGVLHDWGFELAAADLPRELILPGSEAADAGDATTADAAADNRADDRATAEAAEAVEAAAADVVPTVSRRPLRLSATDGRALLRAGDGETLALWRAVGRGRFAVWNLGDTFRLQLADRRAAYGELWAAALGTLARPGAAHPAALPAFARVGERSTLCGVADGATITTPTGTTTPLLVDPASGAGRCAAFWPAVAGWHTLQAGGDGGAVGFSVWEADAAPGLAAAERRAATAALAAQAAPTTAVATTWQPGSRWPGFAAWLLLAAALWALERARAGRGPAATVTSRS